MVVYAHTSVFQQDLLEGEEIMWSGQPDPAKIFSVGDVFMIPFGLFFFGFACFWEFGALSIGLGRGASGPGLIFPLFGIPFVLMGLYMLIGRFIFKRLRKLNTFYAVTNKRILILTTLFGRRNLQAVSIKTLPAINESVSANGYGTVRFGNAPGWNAMYENSGFEFMGSHQYQQVPAFYDTPDAHRVYQLVNELQNRDTTAEATKRW